MQFILSHLHLLSIFFITVEAKMKINLTGVHSKQILRQKYIFVYMNNRH